MTVSTQALQKLGLGTLIIAVAFTLFGVYDSGGSPILWRFVVWLTTISLGIGTSLVVVPWIRRGPLKGRAIALQIGLTALLLSLPVTVAVQILDAMELEQVPALIQWPIVFAQVLVVTLLITTFGFRYWVDLFEDEQTEDLVATFLERLPLKFRGATLYALSAEDHYVRVHTDRGEELVLMRLRDAVQSLGATDGIQVHRSWWVAREGIADRRRDGRKHILVLKSGVEVPVSRTMASNPEKIGIV